MLMELALSSMNPKQTKLIKKELFGSEMTIVPMKLHLELSVIIIHSSTVIVIVFKPWNNKDVRSFLLL